MGIELFFEIFKSTYTSTSSIIEHIFSMFVFIGFLVGFLVSIPLYTLLYLRFQAKISWLAAVLYGAGAWAFTYFLFVRLFEIRLYYGMLFESWMDF